MAAAAPPPAILALQEPRQGTPHDPACSALVEQALARELHGEFGLLGRADVDSTPGGAGTPATAPVPLPPGTRRAGPARRLLDGTFRSLFVDCTSRQAYVSKRGGLADITYWFGPFAL